MNSGSSVVYMSPYLCVLIKLYPRTEVHEGNPSGKATIPHILQRLCHLMKRICLLPQLSVPTTPAHTCLTLASSSCRVSGVERTIDGLDAPSRHLYSHSREIETATVHK